MEQLEHQANAGLLQKTPACPQLQCPYMVTVPSLGQGSSLLLPHRQPARFAWHVPEGDTLIVVANIADSCRELKCAVHSNMSTASTSPARSQLATTPAAASN